MLKGVTNTSLQRSEERFGGRIMKKTFIEMKLFQVKPDRLEQFETKIEEMSPVDLVVRIIKINSSER